jgi:hypothetical protein
MAEMSLADGIDLLQRRGKVLQALLIAGLILSVAMMAGQIAELNGIISLEGEEFTQSELLYGLTAIAYLLLLIGTYVIFGMWIYRAAANVVAAQVPGFDYTPSWAVGWLFIPIANLFKPYGAMRQIDNASQGADGGALNQGNWLLRSWWAAWLIVSIAGNISFRLSLRAETPEDIRSSLEADAVATAVGFVLYPLAYLLVRRITRAQKERLTAAHIFA